jgi:CMP-N,N'-diacetyllegionaminic acid synthase
MDALGRRRKAVGVNRRPEILALIPARGGSKGFPRKNVKPVAGKPLIVHSIETALASRWITRTIVSTDDAEIAEAARKAGAEIPFMRPAEFAQDMSLDLETFRHALEFFRDQENYVPDLVVHLRPTCPIRRIELVDQGIQMLWECPQADSLRSVSLAHETPYKMWSICNGELKQLLDVPGMKEPYNNPRQSLPQVYWQNGYLDVLRPRNVLEMDAMNGRVIIPMVVDEETVDIDYEESVKLAEDLLDRIRKGLPTKRTGRRHSS